MKKSEAINILLELCDPLDLNKNSKVEGALQKLLDAGMSQPSYEGLARDGGQTKFVQGVHNGRDTIMVRNRWEAEEESEPQTVPK